MRAAIQKALSRHTLSLSDDARTRVIRWADEVQKHAKRTNLIGTSSPDRISEELIADSLQLLTILPEHACHLVDVGSGAGVPGLILHGAMSGTWSDAATLIEPRAKRAMFLRHASRAMGLADNTHIFAKRLEDVERADLTATVPRVWVSRAVFAPEKWLDVVAQYAQPEDLCAVWCNGHENSRDLVDPMRGWRLENLREYTIIGPGDRTVLLVRWTGESEASDA